MPFDQTVEMVKRVRANMHVESVQASIDSGRQKEEEGPNPSRNRLQIVTLLDSLAERETRVTVLPASVDAVKEYLVSRLE